MHASAALFGYTTLLGTPLCGWKAQGVAPPPSCRSRILLFRKAEEHPASQSGSKLRNENPLGGLAGKVGETAHLHRWWKWKGGADKGGHMLKPKTNTQQPLPLSVSRSRIFRAICKRKISTKNPKANRRSSLRKMWKEYIDI